MITLKSEEEIKILQEGGRRLSWVLKELIKETKPGVSAFFLEKLARKLIEKVGGKPSFLKYQPSFSKKPFPAALCVSVNEVVVHGLPKKDVIFKKGDLVSLDIGMFYKNLCTDMAYTVVLGKVSPKKRKLVETVKSALKEGIKAARLGNYLGDISYAIGETIIKNGFLPIIDLGGHGLGHQVHEEPFIFNFGKPRTGPKLKKGMVLALEPMAGLKSNAVVELEDGSFVTLDREVSAHFEQTIAITKKGTIVITPFLDF